MKRTIYSMVFVLGALVTCSDDGDPMGGGETSTGTGPSTTTAASTGGTSRGTTGSSTGTATTSSSGTPSGSDSTGETGVVGSESSTAASESETASSTVAGTEDEGTFTGEPPEITRSDVLASLATQFMFPTTVAFHEAALVFEASVAELCATPSADSLNAAQTAWRGARAELRHVSTFGFGPFDEWTFNLLVDAWPARVDAIEDALAEVLAAGQPLTPEDTGSFGAGVKGLPAAEYLLFDPAGGNDAVLGRLTVPENEEGLLRCSFIGMIAADLREHTLELRSAWDPAGGDFAGSVARAGTDSPAYPTVQMAMHDMVNAFIFAVQDIVFMKLGKPLGDEVGQTSDPEASESRFSDNAWTDIASDLEGITAIYVGPAGGLGLSHVVTTQAPDVDTDIRAQLRACDAALNVLSAGSPLRVAVVESPFAVDAFREEVRVLLRLLGVDMAGVLGVTVSISDNDGD